VEWGLDTYSGVRALIKNEVARNGGRIAMDELIEQITSKYSVRANSVVAYASAPPFESRGGIVRLRNSPHGIHKSPRETRHLYRRGTAWLYRVQITRDHLRGSGTAAPMAIAGLLQLQFGETRLLETPIEPQVINWTAPQPSFGSIRRLLINEDIAVDTELFLVIGDDGTFDIEVIPEPTGDPLTDALALIGIATDEPCPNAHELFATAAGLSKTASTSDIIAAYRDRGDRDVADLLALSRHQIGEAAHVPPSEMPADINDILELL
jgi:hypothetical protein